jgi:hypothetical protein
VFRNRWASSIRGRVDDVDSVISIRSRSRSRAADASGFASAESPVRCFVARRRTTPHLRFGDCSPLPIEPRSLLLRNVHAGLGPKHILILRGVSGQRRMTENFLTGPLDAGDDDTRVVWRRQSSVPGPAATTTNVLRRPLRRRVSDLIDISHRTSYLLAKGESNLGRKTLEETLCLRFG